MTEQSQSKAKIALSPLAHSITLFSSHQHLFTKSDIILANFIVQNFESFQHMTILDLAKATAQRPHLSFLRRLCREPEFPAHIAFSSFLSLLSVSFILLSLP